MMAVSAAIGPSAFLGAIFFSLAVGVTGVAQELDLGTVRTAAESGDAEAQRALGEALLFGIQGVEQDKDAGLRLLEQAAAGGNVAAKAGLGKVFLDGYYAPADLEKSERLLQEAAAAGNSQAQATLGAALLWGLYSAADPVRARALLGQASGNGEIEALSVLGEQLVGGWVFDQDIDVGLPLLEKAVAAGDAKAKVALGSFLLYGNPLKRDVTRALALFEAAAQSGNGEGLERYGTVLMWSERDHVAAEEYLRRAAKLGAGKAWTSLADGAMYGYLGRGSRAKFEEFAEKARAEGDERVEVLEANRRMWGISMRASGPRAIEGLEQAAEAGNTEALKFLISLVRNGNQLNIRKRPDQARVYLERFSELLTQTENAQFSMTIDAAKVKLTSAYKRLAEQYDAHPEMKSVWFGEELFAANPNFAVYLLQADMKRKRIYTGPLHGLATRSTLRAILRECRTIRDARECREAVLDPNVIGTLLAR